MTADKIALRELLEKGSDATFLREMIGLDRGSRRACVCASRQPWLRSIGGDFRRISHCRRSAWASILLKVARIRHVSFGHQPFLQYGFD
jgi:hypothetical protein